MVSEWCNANKHYVIFNIPPQVRNLALGKKHWGLLKILCPSKEIGNRFYHAFGGKILPRVRGDDLERYFSQSTDAMQSTD